MTPSQALPAADVDDLRQFDGICDQFEQQWWGGREPCIRDFLERVPESKRGVLAMQLLDVEFEERIARQEVPRIEDYVAAFPSLAEWIRKRLNELLVTVAPSAGTAPSTNRPLAESRRIEQAESLLGKRIGKYELVECLGMGGMGAVYRARHTLIQSERALKLLHPKLARRPEAIQRFLVEAQACIELSHPNIVTTYHVDQEPDGTIYIVMELLRGENLHQLVQRVGPLPVQQAATMIQQAATGLAFVHARGTIHRDVKPHNIMWTSQSIAKILDLGLARILDAVPAALPADGDSGTDEPAHFDQMLTCYQTRLTQRDALLGTLPYIAPEQAADAHGADGRSDIYSLGCTFYYLLTGRHAFVGSSPDEILSRHLAGQFAPAASIRPDIPAHLTAVLDRMMTRDRGQRFASAESVAQALHSWLEEPDVDSSRLRTDGEPVSLEDPKRLRDELVRLQVLSREDWDRAEQGALQRRVPSFDPVSSSVLLDRPPPLQSTHVLEELYRQPGTDEQSSHGLSEFQIQYVLNGDQDLLRLPHHVLLDQVGAGWKGDVFKARNVELNRLEALRVFSPQVLEGLEGTERERVTAFLAFVDRLAALEHPAIPRVYGGGRWQNRRRGRQVYFSTHFVHGLTLHDLVQARVLPGGEPVDLAWSVHTAREVCYALEYAHQRGILHLDVHGLTLKLDSTGRVQLLDLGVALLLTRRMPLTAEAAMPKRRLRASALPDLPSAPAASFDADLRATMSVEPPPMGTPTVMPPEQWKNRSSVSPATDVYNLGCTLFFMLTGQYPFRATNALESMRQHLEKPPLEDPLAQRIPQPLHPILNRALAKAPEKRFSSAQAFGAALDEYIAGHAVSGQSGTQVSPSWLSRLQDWFVNRPR